MYIIVEGENVPKRPLFCVYGSRGQRIMETKEYQLNDSEKNDGMELKKIALLSAEHFTKPAGMSKKDFIKKLEKEVREEGIIITYREATIKRKFA